MNNYFDYEKDLVEIFISNYFKKNNIITIKELPLRWGNIDIVGISNSKKMPFNDNQASILSKPANAKIFMKIKNTRPITKQKIISEIGLSINTVDNSIRQLLSSNLIYKDEKNNYFRNINFIFPKVKVLGYEAKLTDYNKAFYQSCLNKNYVDYSYMVFPFDIATKIKEKHYDMINANNIGLIGVTNNKVKILIKAKQNSSIKSYIKLMALVKTSETISN